MIDIQVLRAKSIEIIDEYLKSDVSLGFRAKREITFKIDIPLKVQVALKVLEITK